MLQLLNASYISILLGWIILLPILFNMRNTLYTDIIVLAFYTLSCVFITGIRK